MLSWKREDVLIQAFNRVANKRFVALQIIGDGLEYNYLRKIAVDRGDDRLEWIPGKISFHGYLPNNEVRMLMRAADLYIMPRNAEEGWGAIASQALVEGCPVIATHEAGSSATLLRRDRLYHADSVDELCEKILGFDGTADSCDPNEWSGEQGARKFIEIIGG